MELPHCGSNCTAEQCNTLDFLPFSCSYCHSIFCKTHFLPESHKCLAYQQNSAGGIGTRVPVPTYSCSLAGCSKRELVPVVCPHCTSQFCLDHRHQPDHNCSKWEKPKERMVQTQSLIEGIVARTKANPQSRGQGPKSEKLAAKVQLMKLKQNSKGLKELPTEERLHLLVKLPNSQTSEGVFVSRLWSMGKCIDSIASLCRVPNHNNVAGQPQLNLFDAQDRCLSKPMDIVAGQLLNQEVLFNGQSVQLRYVSSTDCF